MYTAVKKRSIINLVVGSIVITFMLMLVVIGVTAESRVEEIPDAIIRVSDETWDNLTLCDAVMATGVSMHVVKQYLDAHEDNGYVEVSVYAGNKILVEYVPEEES